MNSFPSLPSTSERWRCRPSKLLIFIVAALIGCQAGFAGADIFVVCNSATELDADDIIDVFIGGKQFSGNTRLAPVDNTAAQNEFLTRVLHISHVKYNTIWIKKSFRDGTRPPLIKADDAETLIFVKKTPGAVGYVRSLPSGVSIIKKY